MILNSTREEYKEWAVSQTRIATTKYMKAVRKISQRKLKSMMEDVFKAGHVPSELEVWYDVGRALEMCAEDLIRLKREEAGEEYENPYSRTNGS